MESQLGLYDEIVEYREKVEEELPDVMTKHAAFRDEVYKDGALSSKNKRLIALGIALRCGCTGCLIAQTKKAVEAGATRAEVLEAVSVGIVMGGTPAMGWMWRVVKTLEEMGK